MPPRPPQVTAEAAGPTLTSLAPDTLAVGGPPATIDVYGAGFDTACVVQADAEARATFFLDAGHLQYTARPDVQTGAQVVHVTVVDGAGAISNVLTFTFTGPPAAATIGFWLCDCGVSISSSSPRPAPPVCVCGRTLYPVVGKVPKVLFDVVWVDQQDQRNR